MDRIRKVAVLGSTGSIGRATLDVLSRLGEQLVPAVLSCHSQIDLLDAQISQFAPEHAVFTGNPSLLPTGWTTSDSVKTRKSCGMESLVTLVQSDEVDTVVAAIVGIAGLESSLAAAQSGKRLALANKEALVVSGSLMMDAVARHRAELLPVDSEHSAIFQCLQSSSNSRQVQRIILTASGGPLRNWPIDRLEHATVDDALSHPTWQMGRKITVDSATMMNKALEIIEARWLFNLTSDQITVVVHPQSTIHSMVEFTDGSVIAQMSPPDMRLPIQYALTYPERQDSPAHKMDWSQPVQLDWRPADLERYPALALGFEVVEKGGSCGAVLNAANEAAVQLFLDKKIRLTDIAVICRDILHNHHYSPSPTLQDLLELDRWSRNEVNRWIQLKC